jgi:putative membrane-bound dehydrogenase-like protein
MGTRTPAFWSEQVASTVRRFALRVPATFVRGVWLAWVLVLMVAWPLVSQEVRPDDATKRATVADGFEVTLVAAEPLVRQPVAIDFDNRGRLWVIQYLQYPNPEGLKRIQVDRFSRTRYDRVPPPPPKGPKGADRITILEDSDGDGRMDRAKDFVSGLNLASGFAFGHGGVFVLNVPYLLFYPDRNRDDVPDGDPEVLLSGFGMEDAHSVANSLTFGPDGWLYGCQGSTVTANIRGIEFQQGVWRYHPVTKAFELFCEGGGNSWGLDFDRTGRLFYSTNHGGHVLLHGVPGGYYWKSFGKHGELHNPHAYGFFDHAPHANFRGGHVTVGGIVYQGDSFPESYRGKYIAADLLGHGVYWHHLQPLGSTVRTAHGGELMMANDTWFAPTDVTLGPDGAVYVSDWHDARTAHPDPDAEWDRTNGRIFRIAAKGTKHAKVVDFTTLSVDQLLSLHHHRNQWFVRHTRQELVRRYPIDDHDGDAAKMRRALRDSLLVAKEETAALESLWTLQCLRGFDESLAEILLKSHHIHVRAWAVRLIGEAKTVTDELAHRLDTFAEREPAVEVRRELACLAARLPAKQAMPIINANINRDIDGGDPYLPLLWWWAVEKHSVAGREEVLKRFVRPTLWKSKLGRDVLLTRLVRRYAAEKSVSGMDSLVKLLKAAPGEAGRAALWPHVLHGWQEQSREVTDKDWTKRVAEHDLMTWIFVDLTDSTKDLTLIHLGLIMHRYHTSYLPLSPPLREREPFLSTVRKAFDPKADAKRRIALLGILATTAEPTLAEPALGLLASKQSDDLRSAALPILARIDDPAIAKRLATLHQSERSAAMQAKIRDVLLARKSFALEWLAQVDRGAIPASATTLDEIRRVALLADPKLNALVAKHWGKLLPPTREEKLAEVRRLNNDLRAGPGDAEKGRALFKTHCGACHQLFGEGTKVGPDLTTANRQDRDFLLVSLVDPSAVIRKEYVGVIVQTADGQTVTGLPVSRADGGVTLVDAKGEKRVLSAGDIAEIRESSVSPMPEDLYRKWKPQELRDLFAYLQRKP